MKTLDRYIARSFIQALVTWLVVMLALRIVADLFVNMDEFAETGKSFTAVAGNVIGYYAYHCLVYFAQLGGVIVVAAAAFAIYRMNDSNELTAMMASGVSLHRVLWPIVVCSLFISGLIVIDREMLISNPHIRQMLARERDDPRGTEYMSVLLLTDSNEAVWYSRSYIPHEQRMVQPMILLRDKQYKGIGRVSGAEARPGRLLGMAGWYISPNECTDAVLTSLGATALRRYPSPSARRIWTGLSAGRIRLAIGQKGEITDSDQGVTVRAAAVTGGPGDGGVSRPVRLEKPIFTFRRPDGSVLACFTADAAVEGKVKAGVTSWRLDRGRLFFPSDLTGDDVRLRQSSRWLDYMSIAELTKLLKLARVTDPYSAVLAKHVRITEPLNNLVMLLIGVPFILSRERNAKASAVRCLLMVTGFYAFVYLSRYIGLPPVWAAWLPVLVFGPVAALMVDAVKT